MQTLPISPGVLWTAIAVVIAFAAGSVVRLASLRGMVADRDRVQARMDSLRTWWGLIAVVLLAAFFGRYGVAVLIAFAGCFAFGEYERLSRLWLPPVARSVCYTLGWAIPFFAAIAGQAITLQVAPWLLLFAASVPLVLAQRTKGFHDGAAGAFWGLVVCFLLPTYAVLVTQLPVERETISSGAGWFLLLILLTEVNDICQALTGRRFGRHKLAPVVSPNKTWEGWAGGLAATVGLALVAGPLLTPLRIEQAALLGAVVSVAGLLGDLNISALKRDADAKDSGTMLAGQGGVLDRIDSLTFTAPVFYHLAQLLL